MMPRSETWWAQAMEDRRVAADAAIRRLFPPDVVRALVDRKLRPWLYEQHLKTQAPGPGRVWSPEHRAYVIPKGGGR